MIVYRITLSNFANDLSGTGSSFLGARWNKQGTFMLYCASNVSLASLEVLANSQTIYDIETLKLVIINIPETVSINILEEESLAKDWTQNIHYSQNVGTNWLKKSNSLVLSVPSAVVPIDKNILINPAHPDFHKVEIIDMVDYHFDNRLFKTHVF